MNMDTNERFKQFYQILENLYERNKKIFEDCMNIKKEWNLKIDQLQGYFPTTTNKIKNFKEKLLRENKKMIAFGETSSGKSTFINALLKRNLVKMEVGATTRCVIKIQLRPFGAEYITVNGERKSINDLQDFTSFDSPKEVYINGFVNVFINHINSDLQIKELEIVDTPGINADISNDGIVQEECNEADIIIIIISCTSIINMTIENFCQRFNDVFSNIEVFIIFNRSEEVDKKNVIMNKYFNDARKLLTEKLGRSAELIENRIFFISAKEQLNNESNVSTDEARLQRNENFENMKKHLTIVLETSHFQRKCLYLDELFSLIEISLDNVKLATGKIESLFSEIIKHIDDYNLPNIYEHNDKIKEIIIKFFEKHYEEFLKESINQYKENGNNEAEIDKVFGKNCINFKIEIENKINENIRNRRAEENINQDYSNILMMRYDSTDELNPLGNHNEELIQSDNDENPVDMRNILEEFYFPLIKKRFNEFKNNKCEENFKEINKKIKNGKIATIGAVACLGLVGAATGGIALGAVAAVEIGAAVGCGIAGGSAAVVGTTTGILTFVKDPFRYFWRNEEKPIKDNWENFKTDLIRLFGKFIEICKLITSVEKMKNELIDVETELERIKQEINLFRMESILY